MVLPDRIAQKPGRLTAEERALVETQTNNGAAMVQGTELLGMAGGIAGCHRARFDGSGYPGSERGGETPGAARIAVLADVSDALTSPRVYRPLGSHGEALLILEAGGGTLFTPQVVQAFATRERDLKKTRLSFGR